LSATPEFRLVVTWTMPAIINQCFDCKITCMRSGIQP
jgi:hypothetical protein